MKTTGAFGEEKTAGYLVKSGYKVLFRNVHEGKGEIDIIAKDPKGTLVFVEVKTLRKNPAIAGLEPEDNMTPRKLKALRRSCEMFVAKHPELVEETRGWRIDLVALTVFQEDCTIKHYRNIY